MIYPAAALFAFWNGTVRELAINPAALATKGPSGSSLLRGVVVRGTGVAEAKGEASSNHLCGNLSVEVLLE